MSESADYILAEITDTVSFLEMNNAMEPCFWIALIASIILLLAVICWVDPRDHDVETLAGMGVLTILVLIGLLISAYFMEWLNTIDLNNLITAYEAVYGPLPEGLIP